MNVQIVLLPLLWWYLLLPGVSVWRNMREERWFPPGSILDPTLMSTNIRPISTIQRTTQLTAISSRQFPEKGVKWDYNTYWLSVLPIWLIEIQNWVQWSETEQVTVPTVKSHLLSALHWQAHENHIYLSLVRRKILKTNHKQVLFIPYFPLLFPLLFFNG